MIAWCVRHKSLTALFSALLLLAGLASFLLLGRQENPFVVAPAAIVQCIYPGATPADVEKSVLRPLEKELAGLKGLKYIQSAALPDYGLITVYLQDMSDAALKEEFTEIRDCVSRAEAELPAEAQKPVVHTDLSSACGLVLGLSSATAPAAELYAAALDLQAGLQRLPGVTAVDLAGAPEEEILVRLDLTRLEQYELDPLTLGQVIAAANVGLPGGSLDLEGRNVPVRLNGEYTATEDLGRTIVAVSPQTGLPVRLIEVAAVTRAERESPFALIGREAGVLIGVRYAEEGNIVSIGRQTRAQAELLAQALPPGLTLTVLTDQAESTREAINLFLQNFLMAVLLVVAVVWVAMGPRSAAIVSFPIALVVAATLAAMLLLRVPLHQVSVASLIISLSLLVANGIVANENIYLFMEKGRDRFTACTEGARAVAAPILTSTLTTIASFLPLAFMQGAAGKFAYSLPVLVSVALVASLVASLTVVPAAGHKYLRLKKNKRESASFRFFARWLRRALAHPARVLLAAALALALSLFLIPGLDIQVFPPLEREQYALEITAPNDYTLAATGRLADRLGELLAAESSVRDFACMVGEGFPKYYMTFASAREGANKAEFLVNGRRAEAENVARRLGLAVPDATVRVKLLEFNMPQTYPVQIRIAGDDIPTLRRAAEEAEAIAAALDGVWLTEIDYGRDSYELSLSVNEEKAALVGVTNYDIAATVRMAVNGLEVSRLKEDDLRRDPIPIILRVDEAQLESREALERIFITSQITGAHVPLRQLVQTETVAVPNRIMRRDRQRTITVGIIPAQEAGANAVLAACRQALADYVPPAGCVLSYGGDNEFARDTLSSMVMPAIWAVLIIYLVLALQFGDLLGPLVIMGTIPLSFIGVIGGLRLFGYPIGFMALLGAISLMGVVVNNGIVLLAYIKEREKAGADPRAAAYEAGVVRLRPVVIGMVTTVISLLPMMLAGGSLWAPLATTVIMGMLVSTLSTMIVIPCLYSLIYGRKAAG
ncbi:MAG: efflux RND transporter permease subunit [Gracilibacteraceae bacterium]|jgi:multidrug efflux pump subunit AcrB|nr:efflux RND transporter permease subunit [Gracilibacteraceae bacterium]